MSYIDQREEAVKCVLRVVMKDIQKKITFDYGYSYGTARPHLVIRFDTRPFVFLSAEDIALDDIASMGDLYDLVYSRVYEYMYNRLIPTRKDDDEKTRKALSEGDSPVVQDTVPKIPKTDN